MIPVVTILMVMIFSYQAPYNRGGWALHSQEFTSADNCEHAKYELQAQVEVYSKKNVYADGISPEFVFAWCATK